MYWAKTSRNKRRLYMAVLGLCFVGLITASGLYYRQTRSVRVARFTYAELPQQPALAAPGLPLRLRIPRLAIDASIEHVGLTETGDLGVPSGPMNVGWYADGKRPGASGSSVLDGHFGLAHNVPAVFDQLHTLQKGDKLQIQTQDGLIMTFVITGTKLYAPSDNAAAVFHSTDGTARLNLITCQGSWSNAQKSYADRLVVFSVKE